MNVEVELMRIPSDCEICLELRGQTPNRLTRYLGHDGFSPVLLAETKDIVAVPSVGALTESHVLVVPKQHRLSLLTEYSLRLQVEQVLYLLASPLNQPDEETLLCFEHGSDDSAPTRAKCGTLHAHLHAVPMQRSVAERIVNTIPGAQVCATPWLDESEPEGEYIAAFTWTNDRFYASTVISREILPSQFMRKTVAEHLSLPEWDWKLMLQRPRSWSPLPSYGTHTIPEKGFLVSR